MKKLNQQSWIYILAILGVLYFLILTGSAAYKNQKTNKEIDKLKIEIETLELDAQNLKNLIAYYQTGSFKEKEARRKLGLVKPDEKMIIISEQSTPASSSPAPESEKIHKANYALWWEFFFK